MEVLVDEAVPVQVIPALRLNRIHRFDHVNELRWKSKQDQRLFRDAAAKGYEAILTLDVDQLSDAAECRALKRSGLHHISLRQGRTVSGVNGTARVIGSIVAAMPYVLDDLNSQDGQRVVELQLLSAARRHETYDPVKEPERYPYWR
jgi:PIN like domain